MNKRLPRVLVALVLVFALCAGLMSPGFAVSDQVTFTGVDTLMIYNPEVDYDDYEGTYSTLSTGNMYGQIKITDGNFNMIADPGDVTDLPFDIGAEIRKEKQERIPVISGPAVETESFDQLMHEVSVGSTKTFFYWPEQGDDYASETAEFTCVYVGEHCLIWGYDFSDAAMAKEMGDEFDDLIYANNTAYFGSSRFMDQGEKMNILVYSFYYEEEPTTIIGFFWGIELDTSAEQGSYAGSYNAGMPIIHINSDICTNTNNYFQRYAAVTVAHEHQHLVCKSSSMLGNGYYQGIEMGTWLNEAMAKEAEELSYPGMVVSNGYISNCYNKSLDISGGQSLYNFTTYYDIGVYGQGFLFSEYIKQLNGGADVYKKIHDYWRTAPAAELTDAAALYSALPESIRSEILGSVDYSAAVRDEFSGEEEEFLSKLALSFHVAAALKESGGIYGMPSTGSEASPLLYTDDLNLSWLDREFTRCDIECGGRIFVKTKDGNSYTVPSDASDKLIYVGFKDGEMVISPTTAEGYAIASYTVQVVSNDTELGTVSLNGNEITASPADGVSFAYPAFTVTSGSAEVVKNGTVFTVYPASDCTVRINFEQRNDDLDLWDGSVAESIPVIDGVYVITTCAQLAKLAQMVNSGDSFSGKTVRLESDLDLNGHLWTPIGKGTAFRGTFAGNGYSISGLTVEDGGKYAGLFGSVSTGGLISDLVLTGASVSGETYVGALAGYCYSAAVSGCTVSGTVSGTGNSVGMLCGSAVGTSVFRCGAEGSVSAPQKTGGLVGAAEGASVVSECRSAASVNGKTYLGGLVGYASGSSIGNCYSRSALSGTNSVGGIGGYLVGSTLTNCYWSGALEAQSGRGGIAGYYSGTSFTGCRYSAADCDYGANDKTVSALVALSEEELKQKNSYSGWDFQKIWKLTETANDGMPVLIWQEFAPQLLSDGLTFDKSAVSDGCVDITVRFAGNGSRLLGLLGVNDEYVTVSRGSGGTPDTLTVSLYYLVTLPVGTNTLHARYSNGFTVPFTVEVVDTTPEEFDFAAVRGSWSNAEITMNFVFSAPEVKDVVVVLAAFHGGRLISCDMVGATTVYGRNEVELKLDISVDAAYLYVAYLMSEEGLVPLTGVFDFTIPSNANDLSMFQTQK